jgi:hypothetical protein
LKTGVTGGFSTFIGFSTKKRRGAIVLASFLSRSGGGGPVDGTVLNIGMELINPGFNLGNVDALYRWIGLLIRQR